MPSTNNNAVVSIRSSYNEIADAYAASLSSELDHKPFDRNILARFASIVPAEGRVCDLGCGPGHVTAHLVSLGMDAFGLDLSPQMVAAAKRHFPHVAIELGDMCSLEIADEVLAGVVAFYSIVNLPADLLLTAFSEMARVLVLGGVALIAFHVGDGVIRRSEMWGRPVSLDFHFHPTEEIKRSVEGAGLRVESIDVRDPYPDPIEFQSRRAYVVARKATPPGRQH